MIERLLLLGMGTVQRSLIELLHKLKHPLLKTKQIICLCPEDIPEYIYKIIPKLFHIKMKLTESNQYETLTKLMNSKTLCVDLTVNTDSIKIINIARTNNTLYINSSIEEYHKADIKNPEKQTLYYQNIELDKELKKVKSDTTILESAGANPGIISNFVFEAIYKYCEDYKPHYIKYLKQNKWSYIASKCVKTIHCSEKDTQQTKFKPKKDYLYQTWSPSGFLAEALSPSFLSAPVAPNKDYKKSRYNKNMYINPDKYSMDCFTKSYIINPDNNVEEIVGRMITHNEVVSLSDKFSTKNYTPFITYVYDSCPISQQSLFIMQDNNYKPPNNLIPIYQEDVINKNSYDSLGACVFFNDDRVYWCGSVLTNNQTMKLLNKNCHSNCTQLQVSISILSFIEYLLKHKYEGVLTSEDLPYKKQIEYCKPFFGNYHCKQIF